MDKEKVVKFWKDGAKEALELAKDVLKNRHYDHALFCGHLALEKLLKSMVIDKTDNRVPRSHDLLYLSGLAGIDLDIEQQKFLAIVNMYNIEGRYPEEKLELYKRATKEYSTDALNKINIFFIWLSKHSEKK